MHMILAACLVLTFPQAGEKQPIGEVLYQYGTKHGFEKCADRYRELKAGEEARYDFSESQLNNLGYRLMGEQKMQAALAIFKLNADLFPASPNCLDSLAEAFLNSGDQQQARVHYQRALSLLAKVDLPQNQGLFLKRNITRQLLKIDGKDPLDPLPKEVIAFLNRGDEPFGAPNPQAPAQLQQLGRLAGIWRITNHPLFQGKWLSGYEAVWVWKYLPGGFAIQDYYYQPEENMPAVMPLPYSNIMTGPRLFDEATGKWYFNFVSNGGKYTPGPHHGEFDGGMEENGEMVFYARQSPNGTKSRIIIYNIEKDRYQWRRESSKDDGKTWVVNHKIDAVRVPFPTHSDSAL